MGILLHGYWVIVAVYQTSLSCSLVLLMTLSGNPSLSLASDHLPIILCINRHHLSKQNFSKSWKIWSQLVQKFHQPLLQWNTHHIKCLGSWEDITRHHPRGDSPIRLSDENDESRLAKPKDPRSSELNIEVNRNVGKYKRNRWVNHLKQY